MKIAVFAAFPHELKHLRASSICLTKSGRYPYRIFFKTHPGCDIIATETGMAACSLEFAFKHVLSAYRPDVVLSIGFGGALYYRADIGELVLASRYFFPTREGIVELPYISFRERAIMNKLQQRVPIKEGSFVTLTEWMPKFQLKTLMPDDAPFPVCDRETIHLAKMSQKSNLPFFAIRSITDKLDQDVPKELFNVTDQNGNYRLSRALRLLVSRPSMIPAALKLGQNAACAAKKLGEAVEALIECLTTSLPAHQTFEKYALRRTQRMLSNE